MLIEKDELFLSLIPIAFNEDLKGGFCLGAFTFFGEPEGIAKSYFAEFKRVEKFWLTVLH